MALFDTLEADIKTAMRARDEVTRDTLRMVLSDLKKLAIDSDAPTGDDDALGVLARAAKTRKESIEQFSQAGRDDLVQKEKAELDVIRRYLPKQLSEDESRGIVQEAITAVGASSKQDLGRVMKEVMARHRGLVDGKTVQKLAGELLG